MIFEDFHKSDFSAKNVSKEAWNLIDLPKTCLAKKSVTLVPELQRRTFVEAKVICEDQVHLDETKSGAL